MSHPNESQIEIHDAVIYQNPQSKANLEATRELNQNFIKSLIREEAPKTKASQSKYEPAKTF